MSGMRLAENFSFVAICFLRLLTFEQPVHKSAKAPPNRGFRLSYTLKSTHDGVFVRLNVMIIGTSENQ